MTLISTQVTYPGGSCFEKAHIQYISVINDNQTAIVTDTTPFHPVNFRWPDQPADKGNVIAGDQTHDVLDCQEAIWDGHQLLIGKECSTVESETDCAHLVVHIISEGSALQVGDAIELQVDENYRQAISLGHSVCHLAALALNKVMRDYWRKDIALDSLGNPDFDRLAIKSSLIEPMASVDVYRLGKSLRKKGFNSQDCFDQLDQIEKAINQQLNGWFNETISISLSPSQSTLNERRFWHCQLPDGEAKIPCGGTHATLLKDLRTSVVLSRSQDDDNEIVMNAKLTIRMAPKLSGAIY